MSQERDLTSPEVTSPLSPYAGAAPPAPDWFRRAIGQAPERTMVTVEGAAIESLVWGERGRPGLLFIHGNGAHADWWSFIAPFFADRFRVAALSLSGMGRSDWRDVYSMDQYGREALAVAEAAGLFEGGDKPLVAAHSFGGAIGIRMAALSGARLKGVAVLDNAPRPPELRWKGPPSSDGRPARVHASLTAALARFRLMPPQGCENHYLLDYIARQSLKPAEGGEGLSWRFDPHIWQKMDRSVRMESEDDLAAALCPMAFVWGEQSQLMPQAALDYTRNYIAPGTPMVPVPEADHHLMLDQPLATVAALRALFEAWPGGAIA